jgi:4-diphosphocytidyl-2-C-methyl-D-erythritol kinase
LRHCQIATGVHFQLFKTIPAGGGLGGASSNAATALLLLNDLFQLGWSWRQLADFSADYGSDIAFFTQPQAAVCTGRGEQVAPCPQSNERPLVVIRPNFGLATPSVFAELARRRARVNTPSQSLRVKNEDRLLTRLCGSLGRIKPHEFQMYKDLLAGGDAIAGSTRFAVC